MPLVAIRHTVFYRQIGVTLVEVLVSVAVASIGLLGMTALTIVSTRINHDAYITTQVNFIAQAFIESMHINASAVAGGRYDGTYGDGSGHDPGCLTHGCFPAERAEYDRVRFDDALHATLPSPAASVKCTAAGSGSPPSAAVYDGTCRLEKSPGPTTPRMREAVAERARSCGFSNPDETACGRMPASEGAALQWRHVARFFTRRIDDRDGPRLVAGRGNPHLVFANQSRQCHSIGVVEVAGKRADRPKPHRW